MPRNRPPNVKDRRSDAEQYVRAQLIYVATESARLLKVLDGKAPLVRPLKKATAVKKRSVQTVRQRPRKLTIDDLTYLDERSWKSLSSAAVEARVALREWILWKCRPIQVSRKLDRR